MNDKDFLRHIAMLNGQIIGVRAVQSSIIKIFKENFEDEDIASKLSLFANTQLKAHQDDMNPAQASVASEYISDVFGRVR